MLLYRKRFSSSNDLQGVVPNRLCRIRRTGVSTEKTHPRINLEQNQKASCVSRLVSLIILEFYSMITEGLRDDASGLRPTCRVVGMKTEEEGPIRLGVFQLPIHCVEIRNSQTNRDSRRSDLTSNASAYPCLPATIDQLFPPAEPPPVFSLSRSL
jgi:hypothetical protein